MAAKQEAKQPGYSLDLYPTERRYSVAAFDGGVCDIDFSGSRPVRMARQDMYEEEEDEAEAEALRLMEEKQAKKKKRFRKRERAPLAKKWMLSDRRSVFEGSSVPTDRADASSAYVLLVPHGPRSFHVLHVAERVTFRKPAPRGHTLDAATARATERRHKAMQQNMRMRRKAEAKEEEAAAQDAAAVWISMSVFVVPCSSASALPDLPSTPASPWTERAPAPRARQSAAGSQ